jgi:hypothetical protein
VKYLAIDPGLTTGVAWFDDDDPFGFESREIAGRYDLYDFVAPLVDRCPKLTVIIERWDVRKDTFGKSAQEDARYIIGYVDGIVHRTEGVTYVEQRPAEAKSFASNAKLKQLDWFRGGEGHADDAARHLLVYLAKRRHPFVIDRLI